MALIARMHAEGKDTSLADKLLENLFIILELFFDFYKRAAFDLDKSTNSTTRRLL